MKVAVYGSLKKGFRAHALLSSSKFLGKDKIKCNFQMYSVSWYPALIKTEDQHEIEFEFYEIDEDTMSELKDYEGYPELFQMDSINYKNDKYIIFIMANEKYITKTTKIIENGIWQQGI